MPDHGISDAQLHTIRAVVRDAGAGITRVDLFGSRALGTHRPHSDIDLAVEGDVSEAQVDRLWTLFHESNLPVSVDVVHYERTPRRLRQHIDSVRRPLLTPETLRADSDASSR